MNRFTLAMSAALALTAPAFAQAPAAKPRIENAADMPRFTYKPDSPEAD